MGKPMVKSWKGCPSIEKHPLEWMIDGLNTPRTVVIHQMSGEVVTIYSSTGSTGTLRLP